MFNCDSQVIQLNGVKCISRSSPQIVVRLDPTLSRMEGQNFLYKSAFDDVCCPECLVVFSSLIACKKKKERNIQSLPPSKQDFFFFLSKVS